MNLQNPKYINLHQEIIQTPHRSHQDSIKVI